MEIHKTAQATSSLFLDESGPALRIPELINHSTANGGPGEKSIRSAYRRGEMPVMRPSLKWLYVAPSSFNDWLRSKGYQSEAERRRDLEQHADALVREKQRLDSAA